MKARKLAQFGILAALMLCEPAFAQALYKLIDKNGKVTYSESKPQNFDGQVIRIDVDSKANTMDAPKQPASTSKGETKVETENERIIRRRIPTTEDKLQAARDKVDAARKAFEDARDHPSDTDIAWISRGAIPLDQKPGAPPKSPVPPPPITPGGAPYNPVLPKPGQKIAGAMPVASDEYVARLAALEKAWHDAEEELSVLERELR